MIFCVPLLGMALGNALFLGRPHHIYACSFVTAIGITWR